ncbi:hypothetical protein GDO86_009888 [Hymenochirus boettgeri]|uniref:Alpha-macroglobulin receptor-binding domain-containing protein n=1 Tax=Hymenochirus boettgeri TaxID=247094 RepID=A0A8T2JNI8_9PIPI|nr:hypothetical protein GDO86_009888 [Hymenochirus boettgeri]
MAHRRQGPSGTVRLRTGGASERVNMTLETNSTFDIVVPVINSSTIAEQQNVTVLSKQSEMVLFPINPKKLGEISLIVKAMSPAASEAKTQKVFVKAEGVQTFYTQNLLLEGPGSVSVSKQLSFTFPSEVVQGSEQAYVTVIGNFLGTSIQNLESLIRLPYGCGEQNMILLAPEIFALQYLSATNQLTENIKTKAINFMEQGYQRELTYKRNDNSFSAFGNNDRTGSTWLSAFVVRCFLQARQFIYIHPEILDKTMQWLVQYQDEQTGIFNEPGHVYHLELQGGVNAPTTLTAYIMTALLEDDQYRNLYQDKVTKAKKYLEDQYDFGISSNYTLSIVVYALSLANSSKAAEALNQLSLKADSTGGLKYWVSSTGASNSWQPRSLDIETAAYALLSYHKQNQIANGVPVMNWLIQQRNDLGGFASTQDTIMALYALAQFMTAFSSNETSLTVSVTSSASFATKTFQIRKENSLVVQTQQFNVKYNQRLESRRERRTPIPEIFALSVKSTDIANNVYQLLVDICSSYQGPGNQTGMVLLEVGILSGFKLHPKGIPISGSLKMLETKYDKVYLYFDMMTKTQVCVTVPLVRTAYVAGTKKSYVSIIDYYEPSATVTRNYNSEMMSRITICDYCGVTCNRCKSNVTVTSPNSSDNLPALSFILFSIIWIWKVL